MVIVYAHLHHGTKITAVDKAIENHLAQCHTGVIALLLYPAVPFDFDLPDNLFVFYNFQDVLQHFHQISFNDILVYQCSLIREAANLELNIRIEMSGVFSE